MNGPRRLSQAISEGDGISLLAPVEDAAGAAAAEDDGAEGIVVSRDLPGLREATGLPILWHVDASPRAGREAGADACVLRFDAAGDVDRLCALHVEAETLGIESVVGVRNEGELALALSEVDPEILLLSRDARDDGDPLETVLDLLPDVPAGKLAIAEVSVRTREEIIALERAGVDAVIVAAGDVARLVGAEPPEV